MEREQHPIAEHRAERERLVRSYGDLFIQRWDTYARQREHSRAYYRVKRPDGTPEPLTRAAVIKHLTGELTIGLYSLDQTGHTRWSVLDSDDGLAPLLEARAAYRGRGIPAYLELSRAGGHLWVFWAHPVSPGWARKILSPFSDQLEVFPAGDIPDEDGLGLLIRAPLGVHRANGQRYGFVDEQLRPVSEGVVLGQIDWLSRHIRHADPSRLAERAEQVSASPARRAEIVVFPQREHQPIARFVATHDIRSVVMPAGRQLPSTQAG